MFVFCDILCMSLVQQICWLGFQRLFCCWLITVVAFWLRNDWSVWCCMCLASGHIHNDRLTLLITQLLQLIGSAVSVDAWLPAIAKGHRGKYGKVNVHQGAVRAQDIRRVTVMPARLATRKDREFRLIRCHQTQKATTTVCLPFRLAEEWCFRLYYISCTCEFGLWNHLLRHQTRPPTFSNSTTSSLNSTDYCKQASIVFCFVCLSWQHVLRQHA